MKEFKIVEFDADGIYHVFKKNDFSAVEKALAQYSADGWEVVSVCPDNFSANIHGDLLITLQRDL